MPGHAIENDALRLTVTIADGQVGAILEDKVAGFRPADGPCCYRADRLDGGGTPGHHHLEHPSVTVKGDTLQIRGKLAGLCLEHTFVMPRDRSLMEERIVLHNLTGAPIALSDFEAGFQRRVTDAAGRVLPELAQDRWAAVPMRARATDLNGYLNDFSLHDLLAEPGYEPEVSKDQVYSQPPSRHRHSEGWAWTHGDATLGIFTFCQENMLYSVVSQVKGTGGDSLRFGGACMISGEPAALTRIAPGQAVDLGIVHYQTIKGGYNEASYAYRALLDENGCRFPKDYNPPVHWEQLYDMSGAWDNRAEAYTRAIVEKEAQKGRDYSCEALYLDPGWDTDFGTFLWGEEWLGPRKQFIEEMKSRYGLEVSLHCPLATWMSHQTISWGLGAVKSWPAEAKRVPPGSEPSQPQGPSGQGSGPQLCLGSRQYLAEAESRLLANCADGVTFLMFDGNWWNGGCDCADHGHPVPYRWEDHIGAVVDLAQRVHARYPNVLIEMHDPLIGGNCARVAPVYYKYGLPGSYDENWGFELMWDAMEDLRLGKTRALYYYNLGCNIPVYTHVSLAQDNESCVILWWWASTCRHLGIGGTSPDPSVVSAQKQAMRHYRELDRFFKRGEFYGINEEIHLHVLPQEKAFVVNLFNLSDEARVIGGEFDLNRAGLNANSPYSQSSTWGEIAQGGLFRVALEMPAWSAQVGEFRAADGAIGGRK